MLRDAVGPKRSATDSTGRKITLKFLLFHCSQNIFLEYIVIIIVTCVAEKRRFHVLLDKTIMLFH